MGRQAVVGGELVEAACLLEQLRADAAARALPFVLRQAGGHVDVVGGDLGRRLVGIRRRGTNIGHRLRRAEQPRAEQARLVRQRAADTQVFERRRIVDRQGLDQLDALGMVGDGEDAAQAVGIGVVDCVDVHGGERHPRMGDLVPGIEAVEHDRAIVTLPPVVQLDLEMVGRAAVRHALAELVFEIVGGQGLAGLRLLEPRRAQVGLARYAGLGPAILGQQAELAVAQPAVASAEFERRLAVVVELRERGRAQAQRNHHVVEAARVVPEIGYQRGRVRRAPART